MANTEGELWSPIDMARWQETPCTQGRLAAEIDGQEGKATFYCIPSDGHSLSVIDIPLPSCAILTDEDGETPVIVIQAEADWNGQEESRLAGYRPLGGGNGICMMYELQLLEGPDDRFQITPNLSVAE
jgi:hypothetical protein